MFRQVVSSLKPGMVRCLFVSEVEETISESELWATELRHRTHVVQLSWTKLPKSSAMIDAVIESFAEIASNLWPSWFGGQVNFQHECDDLSEQTIHQLLQLNEIESTRTDVSAKWLRVAVELCRRKTLPVPRGFNSSVQINQLSLILAPWN